VVGSLAGDGFVTSHGAAAAEIVEAIVVGAAIGSVFGLEVGANDAADKHDQEIADSFRQIGCDVVIDAAGVALGPTIEEFANDICQKIRDGYQYTGEQIQSLYKYLGDKCKSKMNSATSLSGYQALLCLGTNPSPRAN